ncbi:MAG: hypothetical protein ABIY62_00980 [Ginsengibacter sp.]
MKQTITSAKMITIGLFTFFTMGVKNVSFAATKTDNPVEVKFISEIDNVPVIQLNLNNSIAGEYFIIVKDENYHILYCEIVKGVELSRIIKLNMDKDEMKAPGFKVRVEVTPSGTNNTQVFNITKPNGVDETAVISKR